MEWRTAGDRPDMRLIAELDEVRLIIEPAAARLSALRRTADQLIRIQNAWREIDQAHRSQAYLEFHRAVLAAAGNELLDQFEVVLAPAFRAREDLALRNITYPVPLGGYKAVTDAIALGDPESAFQEMHALMQASALTR